jgi:hypothetical protein
MESAIPAMITAVGAVIVAIITRPGRESLPARGLRPVLLPPWVAALFLLVGLYMVAITFALRAVDALIIAWVGVTLLSGLLLAAATDLQSVQLFSGLVVFLLLFTLTLLYKHGAAEHSTGLTAWVVIIAVGASLFFLRFVERKREPHEES